MSSDVKFLLGFVPWSVTFLLLLVGVSYGAALICGAILAALYVLVVVGNKFYKDPPKSMLGAYRDIFFLNGAFLFVFLLGLDFFLRLKGSLLAHPIIFVFVAASIGVFFTKKGFIEISGKPATVVRKLSIYAVLVDLLILVLLALSPLIFLFQMVIFMWTVILVRYAIIRFMADKV